MKTEKLYNLENCAFKVGFDMHVVRIYGSTAFRKYLSIDIEERSIILVKNLKKDYFNIFRQELSINNDSMVVEIWGHVYASYVAKAIKNLVKLQLVESAANFVIKRSDIIDCGEADIDSNRRVWDILANFKTIIIAFLPERLK